MSYYYKKYLKGSSDDEYRRRCDNEWHKHHCKRRCDDDCERPDFDDRPAFGTVTGTTTVAGAGAGVPVTTPLTLNLLSPSENVRVVSGGLEVLERGEYFISFTAFFTSTAAVAPTVTYTINAGGFTQTITPTAGTATASFLRYLRRGDTVTVTATVTAAVGPPTTINATLTVAKVSSRFSEKDFY
ncbi:hypothetical protein H8R29_11665 [Priestia megaterium]|uniref:Uncharacterized protein n=1 Tax=Priestia megaterium (strain ATCC 14581 / DSM 32 / CCUG 1817 / JCM 2506 / NBRC 15308 / NCIMB 9376 / NCTC 10342 / NRRL B-14308 / VKM B-512 / Ford 19) TaxID=1348623 RepID=A0A0B6AYN2_PRIM2|nr:hypothetical protein [Priestia megaterium]AJI25024.1 hypothetical protein BG04_4621 [Priestia megaterium NBRC 15308 = ATCC 14581]KFM98084.1 hypothetical protein DJ91_648 [Priestia megaterium]KGJ73906.1 hypothetical protein BMT_05870 [Priestia megaterium NBRC 15308 = ATCC 14581]MDR4231371.1 hypothetical protein [Priestia megaterium]MED3807638.1 hypothetical protein [Priestia megaterium]